jgi:hypothetical protein
MMIVDSTKSGPRFGLFVRPRQVYYRPTFLFLECSVWSRKRKPARPRDHLHQINPALVRSSFFRARFSSKALTPGERNRETHRHEVAETKPTDLTRMRGVFQSHRRQTMQTYHTSRAIGNPVPVPGFRAVSHRIWNRAPRRNRQM